MDFNQPKTMGMSHLKAKSNTKWRREEELARIEKENHILMRKMDNIFASGERRSKGDTMFAPGVRVDCNQYPSIDCYQSSCDPTLRSMSKQCGQGINKQTLNADSRHREYTRIMEENAALLRRIVAGKPTISRKKALRDRKQQEGYIRNIKDDPGRQKRLAHQSLARNQSLMQPVRGGRIEAWGV
jgi:hypothetical protein